MIILNYLYQLLDVVHKSIAIFASSIAIYLYYFKRDEIKSVFSLLKNYNFQLTLTELKGKLDRLNDFKVVDKEQKDEITNIFHDIIGQLRGNPRLCIHCKSIIDRILECIDSPKLLTESSKRGFVAEMKEMIRTLDVNNFDATAGGKDE